MDMRGGHSAHIDRVMFVDDLVERQHEVAGEATACGRPQRKGRVLGRCWRGGKLRVSGHVKGSLTRGWVQ